MKIKKTEIPIYHTRMTFIESSNYKKVVTYFKKIDFVFKDSDIFAHTIEHYQKEKKLEYHCFYLVFNRKNKHKRLSFGVIVHEASHVADAIFKYIGEEKTEECYAYLIEYLVTEICKFLNIEDEIK